MTERPTISDIFALYDSALNQTRKKIDDNYEATYDNLITFYKDFLKNHIINYNKNFKKEAFRRDMHRELQQRHRANSLRFWAIDGACLKVETSDLAIFYGGAYVVKGELGLQDTPPVLSYRESEPEDDSSLVAYLPLSPEDLTIMDPEDRFVVSDSDRISQSGLDTSLMLLAEIFLLYRGAAGVDRPHLLLWDNSLSSVLANATPNILHLRFAGAKIADEVIWYPDLLVGFSKPWNTKLDLPSKKSHGLWARAIAKIFESEDKQIRITDFATQSDLPLENVINQIKILWECNKYGKRSPNGNPEDALIIRHEDDLILNPEYSNSPAKIERLYLHFCNRFFRDKDPSVLLYEYIDDNGMSRPRFLSLDEISFLLGIGLRLTFEHCWKNGVMLIGIAKDSASTYFTNHYLGVMRSINKFKFTPTFLPGTDRLTFERLPLIDDSLRGPWGSTEFDSVFMTLRMKRNWGESIATLQGVRGNILVSPNLITRSLIQFYLDNQPPMEPLMSHVIFMDRLVHPSPNQPSRVTVIERDRELGTVEPFFFENNSVINREQELAIYLLSVLTQNVFPEVIGYPDPLHYADRGAKSVLRMVEPMLRSSERINRINPNYRKFRQTRGG